LAAGASHVAEPSCEAMRTRASRAAGQGTGASIAANKVPGIRAALVPMRKLARARAPGITPTCWPLSLRATPIPVMREILDAWFAHSFERG